MNERYLFADLIAEGLPTVRFWGRKPDSANDVTGFWISDSSGVQEGVKDWYSQPALKMATTEMQTGDGAHMVYDDSILYSARTVTLGFTLDSDDRELTLSLLDQISQFAHQNVVLRVVDAEHDTYVQGVTQAAVGEKWYDTTLLGSLTVVCVDPYRYGSFERAIQLAPASGSGGGLVYDKQKSLHYPLSYGAQAARGSYFGTLVNLGSTAAFPTISVHGPFPYGVRIDTRYGVLTYDSPVFSPEVPVVFDCRTRTVTQGGADVTRRVSHRGWPRVPKGGSLGFSLQTMDGSGWVDVTVRDTYL